MGKLDGEPKTSTENRLFLLTELESDALETIQALTKKEVVRFGLDHSIDSDDGEEVFSISVTVK